MGSSEINKENIITATMEELTEEERKAYLLVEEHVKAQFLKGFKKDRGGLVKRVEEFVLPSLKLNQDKIEEIPNVSLSPSDMFDRMSSLMDQKIIAAQAATGDMLVKLSTDVDALKGKQPMSDPNSSDPSSATPEFTSEPLYGMPPNSFSGQTPPPSTVHTAPVGPVPQTGQTGTTGQTGYQTGQTGYSVPSPTPLETIPGSAAPSRTNELSLYTPPRIAAVAGVSQGSGPNQGPIPTSLQTMAHGNPNAHRFSEFYTSQHYQADLLKFKEDLANAIKNKLGVDMGTTRLYQKPYPAEFDFTPFPVGWHIPEFTKFNGDDSRTTWGKPVSMMLCACICFFIFDWNGFLLVFFACSEFYSQLESIGT